MRLSTARYTLYKTPRNSGEPTQRHTATRRQALSPFTRSALPGHDAPCPGRASALSPLGQTGCLTPADPRVLPRLWPSLPGQGSTRTTPGGGPPATLLTRRSCVPTLKHPSWVLRRGLPRPKKPSALGTIQHFENFQRALGTIQYFEKCQRVLGTIQYFENFQRVLGTIQYFKLCTLTTLRESLLLPPFTRPLSLPGQERLSWPRDRR